VAPDRGRRLLAAAFGTLAVLSWAPGASGAPEEAKPAETKNWGESPFLAERGGPKPTVTGGTTSSGEESLVLKGILWDLKSPSAIVNGHVVSAGERLGRWHVVEIRKDRVILSDGSSTREILVQ